ncbi:GNAT family protein [Serratia marcescens]|uniref:hypothetical protein n=1 Tax=Serratia marcescens TaxID=615 RepID=UPI00313A98F2
MLCHGTVCVVGKIRDLILQLSKSSIYSTKPGQPCAFQLITRADSPEWICFDYVNGGYDREHNGFCPGTIVTWLNVRAAYELCEREGKEMRYSFGKPTEAYKDRWCERAPLGRTLSI